MAAGTYNIVIEQGTTFELPVTVSMDLTGWTARMQIKTAVGVNPSILDLTTANGGITIDADVAESDVVINIPAATSAGWPAEFVKGVYDLEIVSPTGRVMRLIKGTVAVDPEVTTIP